MKIYNTLTKQKDQLRVINDNHVSIYSCGPTVYDRAHIGNLISFIYADTLNRILKASNYSVHHVINYTDVDDKTINRSAELYPNALPNDALQKLTISEIDNFLKDAQNVGINTNSIEFIKATDSIDSMQKIIKQLLNGEVAYLADDGIYFSIQKYISKGHKYGQLSNITLKSTSEARINNDEYDKDSAHDFALWKFNKNNEPSWDFIIDGVNHSGRPGWHIECSAMSTDKLGQPFDIHTGGIDLIFPHHENEIAQSTAIGNSDKLANIFMHNEHLLVDGKKMSKSLQNFYTLKDIQDKKYNPLSLRLLALQAHYRSILHFSWQNLESAQNRLMNYQSMADLRWQPDDNGLIDKEYIQKVKENIVECLQDDLNTPKALSALSEFEKEANDGLVKTSAVGDYNDFIAFLDDVFGLNLMKDDINDDISNIINGRNEARQNNNFDESDKLRDQLIEKNIGIRDTQHKTIWYRL